MASGALFVVLAYHHVLPLLGLGCALALMAPRLAALAAILFVLGLGLGVFARELMVSYDSAFLTALTRLLLLTSSLSCLVTGLCLAIPPRVRNWLVPPAAVVLGATLATATQMNSPEPHAPGFAAGAAGAAFWLVATVFLMVRGLRRPWLPTAARILGSWLIAIGLLVGGTTLAPRRAPDAGLVQPSLIEEPPAHPPGIGRDIPEIRPQRPLFPPPGFEGAQQP